VEPEIVTVGHIVNETIRFPDRTVGPVLGGPASYTSVVASRLGRHVGLVTVVGADLPLSLLDPIQAAGVDMRGVRHRGPHTTASLLLYDPVGNKEIRYPRKAPAIRYRDLPITYRQAAAVHIGAMDWDVTAACLARIAESQALQSIDLGGFGGVHSRAHPTEREWADPVRLARLVARFHIVRASVEDARYLLGVGPERASDVARLFITWGAEVGILSRGAQGAIVAHRQGSYHIEAAPARVVDCTGAGDCFSMGFLVEYLRSRNPLRAGQFAAAVAAHVIEGTGGVHVTRMPTMEDVMQRLSALG
jgi:sugar/nucleoside kinase (ribokinase family)